MDSIIQKPIITEKTLGLAQTGWFTFAVSKFIRKEQIAPEMKKLYNVTVKSIRMIAMHGKTRRSGKKSVYTKRPDWKKVLVQLPSGQRIDAFDITAKEKE